MAIVVRDPYVGSSTLPLEPVDVQKTIGALPIEMWLRIFTYLTDKDIMATALVNDTMRRVVRYLPPRTLSLTACYGNQMRYLFFSIRILEKKKAYEITVYARIFGYQYPYYDPLLALPFST